MDAEFNAQWGLAAVKAEYALAKGLTGAGIDVVIVDSLLIKQHIRSSSGRVGPYIYNPAGVGFGNHGTHVAGIIGAGRNGFGMEGVAPDVILSNIVMLNPAGNGVLSDAQLAAGYDGAIAAGLRIFNNSWGINGTQITNFTPAGAAAAMGPLTLQSLHDAVDAGAVMVFATGNDFFDNPSVIGGIPYYYPRAHTRVDHGHLGRSAAPEIGLRQCLRRDSNLLHRRARHRHLLDLDRRRL